MHNPDHNLTFLKDKKSECAELLTGVAHRARCKVKESWRKICFYRTVLVLAFRCSSAPSTQTQSQTHNSTCSLDSRRQVRYLTRKKMRERKEGSACTQESAAVTALHAQQTTLSDSVYSMQVADSRQGTASAASLTVSDAESTRAVCRTCQCLAQSRTVTTTAVLKS